MFAGVSQVYGDFRAVWNNESNGIQDLTVRVANGLIGFSAVAYYFRHYTVRPLDMAFWSSSLVSSQLVTRKPRFWFGKGDASVKETLRSSVDELHRMFVMGGSLITIVMLLRAMDSKTQIPQPRPTEAAITSAMQQPHLRWQKLFSTAVKTPILEEILHRGIIGDLVEGTRERIVGEGSDKGQRVSRGLRSALFVARHLWDAPSLGRALITTFQVGLGTWPYEVYRDTRRSLWSSILAHGTCNAWSCLISIG